MDLDLFGPFGLLLLGAALIFAIVDVQRKRKRHDRIAQWAAEHCWSITKKPAVSWAGQLPGRNGRVRLLVCASIGGLTVGVAEYTYTTSSGSSGPSSNTTKNLLVTTIRLPHRYSAIAVVRRGVLSQLGRAMLGDTAFATGDAEFDDRFRIDTRHPDLARALVGPALIAEHLAEHIPTWSLADHDLLTWQDGKIGDPEQIPALVEPLMRVAQLLPPMPR
jgi:hypothetical protein